MCEKVKCPDCGRVGPDHSDTCIHRKESAIKIFAIFELIPTSEGVESRMVIARERREEAERVLKVLEETNVLFDCYEIRELRG